MRIGVFGLGNVLRRDDGFGPTVVARLAAAYAFPDHVAVRDLGSPGLDLAARLADVDFALLLDTVLADGPPGTLHVLEGAALKRTGQPGPRMTQHEADLGEALAFAELAGCAPREVRLIGAVPADLGQGPGLTPALEEACAHAADRALAELAGLGIRPRQRAPGAGAATGAWWTA